MNIVIFPVIPRYGLSGYSHDKYDAELSTDDDLLSSNEFWQIKRNIALLLMSILMCDTNSTTPFVQGKKVYKVQASKIGDIYGSLTDFQLSTHLDRGSIYLQYFSDSV